MVCDALQTLPLPPPPSDAPPSDESNALVQALDQAAQAGFAFNWLDLYVGCPRVGYTDTEISCVIVLVSSPTATIDFWWQEEKTVFCIGSHFFGELTDSGGLGPSRSMTPLGSRSHGVSSLLPGARGCADACAGPAPAASGRTAPCARGSGASSAGAAAAKR